MGCAEVHSIENTSHGMTVGDVRDVMYRDRRPLGGLMMRPAADEKKGQSGNSSLGVAGVE